MSALATFLVVLVQFRDQDEEDASTVTVVSKNAINLINSSTPTNIPANTTN